MMDYDLSDYTKVILKLNELVNNVGQDFILTGYNNLAYYLQTPFALATILLITLMGYGILMGFLELKIKELNKIALTIGIIQIFAFNFSGWFTSLFYEFFFF